MKDTSKNTLDAILKKHNMGKKEAAARHVVQQKKANETLERFYSVRASIIRPVMESIGEHLTRSGHTYEIREGQQSGETRGFESMARIVFYLYLDSVKERSSDDYPHLTFFLDGGQVSVHESTMGPGHGGQAGTIGKPIGVNDVTSDLVEEKLVAFIQVLFRGGF